MQQEWLKAADFEKACRIFDSVHVAEYFRVLLPDRSTSIVTRARLEELAHSPDVDRIAYWPISDLPLV